MSGILVIAEHLRGALSVQTGEAIGLARDVKARLGGPLRVAVISDKPDRFHADLALDGVDEVLCVPAPDEDFDAAIYTEATVRIALETQPRLVMIGHSVNGMGYGPAVAVRLGGSFVSDAFAVEADGGRLTASRGGYGNKVITRLDLGGHSVSTLMIRGGSAKAPAGDGLAPARTFPVDFSAIAAATAQHAEYVDPPAADVDITKAEFILSVGRGIQDEKNIERFRALAERLGGDIRLLAPDRRLRLAAEGPPGRTVGQGSAELQALCGARHFGRGPASARHEARGNHHRRKHGSQRANLQCRHLWCRNRSLRIHRRTGGFV